MFMQNIYVMLKYFLFIVSSFFLVFLVLDLSCLYLLWELVFFLISFPSVARLAFPPFQAFFKSLAFFGCPLPPVDFCQLYKVRIVIHVISRHGEMSAIPLLPGSCKLWPVSKAFIDGIGPSCQPVSVASDSPIILSWGHLEPKNEDPKAVSFLLNGVRCVYSIVRLPLQLGNRTCGHLY